MQKAIPCVIMRGGTSRGPYLIADHLPTDPARRDAVLLAIMGSPHAIQIDGIGGSHTVTSKVAIVSRSKRPGVDVDYLFAQVSIDEAIVDTRPNCGNMLSGVAPFAIEAGLVEVALGQTYVRIFNVNSGATIDTIIQTPGGHVTYEGDTAIPGVPGTAAPIPLTFRDFVGTKAGQLFPTGNPIDEIEGLAVTLIDSAMPMLLLDARALGFSDVPTPKAFEADRAAFARVEAVRRIAGQRMGLGDVSDAVIPKVGLLGADPTETLAALYLTPKSAHKALAVTGAICISTAALTPGTIAHRLARAPGASTVTIRHPSGVMDLAMEMKQGQARGATVMRTARRILEGRVFVPARLF